MQTPITLTTADGRTIQIGRGGYLRPVYLIRVEGTRWLIAAVLGWIDTRSGEIEAQALALAA